MNDDDFVMVKRVTDVVVAQQVTQQPIQQRQKQVLLRTLWTKQTFIQYPNGELYLRDSQSWFDNKTEVYKKKEKDKIDAYKVEEGKHEM